MSLRGFHVVFIILAFLCAGGFYAWYLFKPQLAQELNVVLLAQSSGVLAASLFCYGIWFVIKKFKTIQLK